MPKRDDAFTRDLASIDALDRAIMVELQDDGRRSYREIAHRLGVAPGTVRSRLLQLIQEGIFHVIAIPDPWRMGYRFHATVGLRLEPGHARAVGELLARREEVGWIGLMSTGYDVMFEVTLPDSRSFGGYKEDFLAELPGCVGIDVFEIWAVPKFRYRLTPQNADPSEGEAAVEGRTG
jgi:Lrp/AsnC family transcriptional regulator for asnA, asnC and gidA